MASGGHAASRCSAAGDPLAAGEGMTSGDSDVAGFDPLLLGKGSEHRTPGAASTPARRFVATAQGVHDAEEYWTLVFEHANSAPWPLRMDVLVPWLCELDRLASGEAWGVSQVRAGFSAWGVSPVQAGFSTVPSVAHAVGTSGTGAGIAAAHGRGCEPTQEWLALSASSSGRRHRRGYLSVSDPRYPDSETGPRLVVSRWPAGSRRRGRGIRVPSTPSSHSCSGTESETELR